MRNTGNDPIKEKECVEAIRKGDEYAFKKLFLRYYDPLCNFAWRFTRSKSISEDIVQDLFSDLWNLRKSLDPQQSISVYLYQAVKNKALDHIDHQKVVRRHQSNVAQTDKNVVQMQERIHTQEEEKFIKAVRQAIDDLPQRAQQVYILHREDGLTYREIAEVMDISIKTVESQMSRALDLLRARLRKHLPDQVTDETITKIYSIKSGTGK